MRATLIFLLLNSSLVWSCPFQIENAELDSTCTPEATSYELSSYYKLNPPRLRIEERPDFNSVIVNGRRLNLPVSIPLFLTQEGEKSEVRLEFLKGNKSVHKVTLRKFPEDFPHLKVSGQGTPGYFLLAPMRIAGGRSFALILDERGRVIFFKAFEGMVLDYRKQGSYFTLGVVEKMTLAGMHGSYLVYEDPLREIHKISPAPFETRWGPFSLDLHDLIYRNPENYIYIRTYPEEDLFHGCVFHNEVVEKRNGMERILFSSRNFLSREGLNVLLWPVFSGVNNCKSYFHLNSMQVIPPARRFLLSSRTMSGIHLWSDQAPLAVWNLGANFQGQPAGLEVVDWAGQHTPDYSFKTGQIIVFDNGYLPNRSSIIPPSRSSRLVLIDLDKAMKPTRSQAFPIFDNYRSNTMGSVQWYNQNAVVIGAGFSSTGRPFDLAELDLPSRVITFKATFRDPAFMNYRVYKVQRLDQ